MAIHPRAGQRAQQEDMHNIPALVANYFLIEPSVSEPQLQVAFGTSGHRGTADKGTFNQHHIWAIAQAVAEVRAANGVTGPLFLGKDTHALSEPAFTSTLEVLVANNVKVVIQEGRGYTPTPGVSHAILCHNKANADKADGIVITPSHNPPQDGGIKYNPPVHGGPAEGELTTAIEKRANEIIANGMVDVKRVSVQQAFASESVLIKS